MHDKKAAIKQIKFVWQNKPNICYNGALRGCSSVGLEYLATNQGVVGSNPASRAKSLIFDIQSKLAMYLRLRWARIEIEFQKIFVL